MGWGRDWDGSGFGGVGYDIKLKPVVGRSNLIKNGSGDKVGGYVK